MGTSTCSTATDLYHGRRVFWFCFSFLLALTTLYTGLILASHNLENPWVSSVLLEDNRNYGMALHWPYFVWVESHPVSLTATLVKNLETGEIYDLSPDLPCPSIGSNGSISIDGDWLVLIVVCDFPTNNQHSLQAFNLVTHAVIDIEPPSGIPPDQIWPYEPEISGNRVVWHQEKWYQHHGADVYLFDLQSQTALSLTHTSYPWIELGADIDQEWAVWDAINQITDEHLLTAYNISTTERITIPLPGYPYHIFPTVDQNVIVWSDNRDSSMGSDIYAFDLTTRQMFIIVTGPETQFGAKVDDGLVVYTELLVGTYDSVLLVHHLATGETYQLYQDSTTQNQELGEVDIDHGVIVYEDIDFDVLLADIFLAQQLPERLYLPILAQSP